MTLMFGWCLPGINQHTDCIAVMTWNGEVRCPCSCHGGEVTVEVSAEEDVVD